MNFDFLYIFKLVLMSVIPVLVCVIVYLLDKKTKLKDIKYVYKQIIIGLIFGGLAILATVFGLPLDGAILNVRDSAPLIAGLVFGGLSGIISGIIGGIYRFVATYWGAGAFSQIACSISCVLAGVFAAFFRKFVSENKRTTWINGFIIASTTEVFHMLLIFVTNLDDVYKAYNVVSTCSVSMIVCNSLSVMLSIITISLLNRESFIPKKGKKQISQIFQYVLAISVAIAFIASTVFTYKLQTTIADTEADNLLSLNLNDVESSVEQASDDKLLKTTKTISTQVTIDCSNEYLKTLAESNDVSEINIINQEGKIVSSSNEEFINYDMASGEQSKEFLCLLDGSTIYFVQKYQPTSSNSNIYMKYAGVVFSDGFVQVGYNATQFQSDLYDQISWSVKNRHIGQTGGIIVCNEDGIIIFDNSTGHKGESIKKVEDNNGKTIGENIRFTTKIGDIDCYCMYVYTEGFYIISYLPRSEVMFSRNIAFTILAFMEIIVFAALFIHMYILLSRLIVDNIHKINNSLEKISNGDLTTNVDVKDNVEFASLSDDINSTVKTLKKYISDADSRIDKELEFARQIQMSSLPSVFPPYPERKDFDIYALMDTAKEVGGDFYDFYMTDKNHIVFLVADVSGKGIPASLFMMKAKTIIKNLAESGRNVGDVFTEANRILSENNEAEMFVTAWMGILDLTNGVLQYANAGHNPPLLARNEGKFEYLRSKPNFILAGLEDTVYRINEIQLYPTDRLFIYTDGITEANDIYSNFYGEDRLKYVLNKRYLKNPKDICKAVKDDVSKFAGNALQSDDITMLCFRLDHLRTRHELTIKPNNDSLETVLAYVEDRMKTFKIDSLLASKAQIATDEIWSNFVNYSKAEHAKLYVGRKEGKLVLIFSNDGIKFDPTEKEDPNTKATLEERQIGGLGIFIVKKTANVFKYEYIDNQNVITVAYDMNEDK